MMQSEESCQSHDKEAYPLLSTKYTLCTQGLYNTGTPVDLLYVCVCVYTQCTKPVFFGTESAEISRHFEKMAQDKYTFQS